MHSESDSYFLYLLDSLYMVLNTKKYLIVQGVSNLCVSCSKHTNLQSIMYFSVSQCLPQTHSRPEDNHINSSRTSLNFNTTMAPTSILKTAPDALLPDTSTAGTKAQVSPKKP